MPDMKTKLSGWMLSATPVGLALLSLVLLVLGGCAAGGKPQPEPVADEPVAAEKPSVPQGPIVESLGEGRGGFRIRETPQLDAELRNAFDRATAMLENKDYEQAVELLQTVIAGSPEVSAPYINLAMAYKHLDRLEQAEKHLKTALTLVPEHPVASNEYGLLLRRTGRFEEARAIYEKTLAAFPDYVPAHLNLGILCDLYLNDLECALGQYEIYSEARPENEEVKIWIADLRMRLGR